MMTDYYFNRFYLKPHQNNLTNKNMYYLLEFDILKSHIANNLCQMVHRRFNIQHDKLNHNNWYYTSKLHLFHHHKNHHHMDKNQHSRFYHLYVDKSNTLMQFYRNTYNTRNDKLSFLNLHTLLMSRHQNIPPYTYIYLAKVHLILVYHSYCK